MSLFDKITDVTHVYSPKPFLHRGRNEISVANIVKIRRPTFNKDVLNSEWTLTSRALRLVCA